VRTSVAAEGPGFTLAATLTLGLGIGACVAVFSAIDTVPLAPAAFPEPDRLVRVAEKTVHARVLPVAYRNFQDLAARSHSFAGPAAISGQDFTLQGIGDAERIFGAKVSADFLSTFGAAPAFGRDFTVDDDKDGAAPVAILGPDIWRRLFGADPGVIGRTVVLDGRAYSIVGIAPSGFRLPLAQPVKFLFRQAMASRAVSTPTAERTGGMPLGGCAPALRSNRLALRRA